MTEHPNIFRYQEESPKGKPRIVGAIFLGSVLPASEILCDTLDSLYDLGAVPDIITFVVPTTRPDSLLDLLSHTDVVSRFRNSPDKNAVRVVTLGSSGIPEGIVYNVESKRKIPLRSKLIATLKTACLTQWFRQRGGMMEPGPGFYYRKPSRKAVNRFLRTGNILLDSDELKFLCFWLVGLLQNDIRTIWVDSSTILSVGYALANAAKDWLGLDIANIKIRSFESYRNFVNVPVYNGDSLVIVSASSGGAMAVDCVVDKRYPENRVATLFFLPVVGRSASDRLFGTIICNLEIGIDNPEGFEAALISTVDQNIFPSSCRPIHIAPEGFLPDGLKVETLTIGATHIPDWYKELAPDLLGNRAVSINRVDECQGLTGGKPRRLSVAFELSGVWKNFTSRQNVTPIHSRLNRYLKTRVPSTLKLIIHAGDKQSIALATCIKTWLASNGASSTDCISISDYSTSPSAYSVDERSPHYTLVVGSSLVDLHPLINASQLLRDTQRNHAMAYLVGLQLGRNKQKCNFDKANLKFCNNGADYDVDVLATYYGNWLDFESSPWELELDFWERIPSEAKLTFSRPERESIKSRVDELQVCAGLTNNLFLPGPRNQKLKLRSNSAFLSGLKYVGNPSQAEAAFMVSCTLSSLVDRKLLVGSTLHRVLLDPENFSRYSDGVLQASMIRLCQKGELAYSLDKGVSAKFSKLILDLLSNIKSDRCEGLTEILLAICMGSISLRLTDSRRVLAQLKRCQRQITNPILRVLIRYMALKTPL